MAGIAEKRVKEKRNSSDKKKEIYCSPDSQTWFFSGSGFFEERLQAVGSEAVIFF
jgi:hypothetical protein